MMRALCAAVVLALATAGLARSQCSQGSANQTIPACIALVGLGLGGQADPAGAFTITVRGPDNNPCPGSLVKIDFSNCPDLTLAPSSGQTWPGMTVDCSGHSVRAFTDATGKASFSIVGAARNPTGGAPPSPVACAVATADGLLLGNVNVQAFNEDGSAGPGHGVGGNDVSAWKGDFFSAGNPYFPRSDFDCNQSIGGNDLSRILAVLFAAGSLNGPSGYCP